MAFFLYNISMTDTNELVEQVKLATKFQTNKRALKESITAELHMPYNGGMFYITPALLAFVATWPDEELYLEDVYENPVPIKKWEFYDEAKQRYYAVMNEWHNQHQELKRVRKV